MRANEFRVMYRPLSDNSVGRNHNQQSCILCFASLRKKAVPFLVKLERKRTIMSGIVESKKESIVLPVLRFFRINILWSHFKHQCKAQIQNGMQI